MRQYANLINGFTALIRRRLWSHHQVQLLPLAFHVQSQGLAVRTAAAMGELAPPLNLLPVYRRAQVILFQSGALRRVSRRDICADRTDRQMSQHSISYPLWLLPL